MQARNSAVFKTGSSQDWTRERIERLSKKEIEQLQANAERLGVPGVVELCTESLKSQRKQSARKAAGSRSPHASRHLVSRASAFAARGVFPHDASSWGGVRKTDSMVVMTLWAGAVRSAKGGCSYLLWAPNVDDKRPWSDLPAGKERLEHCRLALGRDAEGLLVYGESLEGHLPEEKVHTIHGVDTGTILSFKVEKRGDEYWAAWGKKKAVPA